MKRFILILVLFILLPKIVTAAMFDPSFNFSTIETKHFNIHYHQGLENIAKRAATISEEIHGKLTKLLQWHPEKTDIVIADSSDFANGMTTVAPYNVIYLQTAPPAISSSIGEYDNWLRLLIIHEYAHVLTSDPVRGYSAVTRKIFGKVVPVGDFFNLLAFVAAGPPNMMMPRWWHEGMSTWAETELTSSGRGRSSYYQMFYRTAVAEENLPGIDKINGDVPYWPAGNSPYIFGSRLIQFIAEKHGKELPGSISIQQSGRFPYFINEAPENQLGGNDYSTIYSEMLKQMTKEQKERISLLDKELFTRTRMVGKIPAFETNPRYSHDGKMLAYNRNDGHSHPVIVIQAADGSEIAKIHRQPGDGSISWNPDDASIIFSQAELSREVNYYQDLYRYDLKKKKVKRLTKGSRAAEPDISPDGSRVVFVINSRGNQNIGLSELKEVVEENNVIHPKFITDFKETRISSPRWSPDGKSIVFAMTSVNGDSSLNMISIETLSIKELLNNGSSLDAPSWSPDGKEILFSSDQTGVFNIYSYNLASGECSQKTHLLSGAFSPDISPADQTLSISQYSSSGNRVALIAKKDLRSSPLPSPSIKDYRYPVDSVLTEETAATIGNIGEMNTPYNPLPTLLPKFWVPALIAETSSSAAIGAMTAGQDVLGYHRYLGKILYGAGFNKTYFDTIYQYCRFIPAYSLHAYALPSTYTGLITSGDFTQIEHGLVATYSTPIGSVESGLSIKAGYHLRNQKPLTEGSLVAFNGKPVFQGVSNSYFAGMDYSKTDRYPWSISTEKGRKIALSFEYYGKASGSEVDGREYTAAWEEHIPTSDHHNIFLRINGGFADGEQTAQQSFQMGGTASFLNPFGLRGYDSQFRTGNRIATGTAEYRFPISYPLHGYGTKPLFLDRLHGALFVDAGETWSTNRSFKGNDIMTGTGAEIRLDMTIGYWLKITPAIGYAHGFDRVYGTDQIYFNIYANL